MIYSGSLGVEISQVSVCVGGVAVLQGNHAGGLFISVPGNRDAQGVRGIGVCIPARAAHELCRLLMQVVSLLGRNF